MIAFPLSSDAKYFEVILQTRYKGKKVIPVTGREGP
jgi:hypothetical protein